ncbi:MAG: methyltransferase [Nocardioides sp.]
MLHTKRRDALAEPGAPTGEKAWLLPADDPVLVALGIATSTGGSPTRQAKYRQVEELCRQLDAALTDAVASRPAAALTEADPLRVDRPRPWQRLPHLRRPPLTAVRGLPVRFTGVDVKEQSHRHNIALARELDRGVVRRGTIADAVVEPPPEVVLALHACDNATDEALARAVEWGAQLVPAAPCRHHDLAAQLRGPGARPYALLTEHGILRERFATLTDAVRAALLRTRGYHADVVEFVESVHTPQLVDPGRARR